MTAPGARSGLRYPCSVTATLIRRAATLLLAVAVTVLAASPAGAEVPEGWSDPEEVGLLDLLLVVGAIPVGIALLIALAVYLPALARGERVAPGSVAQDEWFGGPRRSAAELESREAGPTGGGSGSW